MGHSQNHFPLRGLLSLWSRHVGLAIAASLLLASVARAAECPGSEVAEQLRQNTVRIQSARTGFGFIVGERNGSLYIATARHILVAQDQPDAPPAKAKISFYSDQGTTYDAEILGTHEADLAVLRIRKPAGFQWVKASLAGRDQENRGTQVWFVGKGDQWTVPCDPGSIVSEQPSTRSQIEVERLSVAPGTSGAPLISASGVVGMIQNDSAEDTRALTIDFIERAFKEWNHPWDLTLAPVAASAPSHNEPAASPVRGTGGEQSGSCAITVTSNPPGAQIAVDGVARGRTPGTISIARETRPYVSLSLENYGPLGEYADCSTTSMNLNLERVVQQQRKANITLRYIGDLYGCRLLLTFKIGNKTVTPNSNPVAISDVNAGLQPYTISGQIVCGYAGTCRAGGTGSIVVQEGGLYDVSWRNTAYATCMVGLTGPE